MKYVKYVGAGLLLLLAAVFLLGTIADEKHLLYGLLTLACAAGAWALTKRTKKKKKGRWKPALAIVLALLVAAAAGYLLTKELVIEMAGEPEMTLDEINAEIRAVREKRRKKQPASV